MTESEMKDLFLRDLADGTTGLSQIIHHYKSIKHDDTAAQDYIRKFFYLLGEAWEGRLK